jgi:hypothetical protein
VAGACEPLGAAGCDSWDAIRPAVRRAAATKGAGTPAPPGTIIQTAPTSRRTSRSGAATQLTPGMNTAGVDDRSQIAAVRLLVGAERGELRGVDPHLRKPCPVERHPGFRLMRKCARSR